MFERSLKPSTEKIEQRAIMPIIRTLPIDLVNQMATDDDHRFRVVTA